MWDECDAERNATNQATDGDYDAFRCAAVINQKKSAANEPVLITDIDWIY